MLLWYDTNRRPRPNSVFSAAASDGETSGPNGMPARMIRLDAVETPMGLSSRSPLGLVLRVCAANGHLDCVVCSSGKLYEKSLLRDGSLARLMSSAVGATSTGAPTDPLRISLASQVR
jgi:hypothetical protein